MDAFWIAGIALEVLGACLMVYSGKAAARRAEKFADEHLPEYEDGQAVPEAKVREFMKRGAAKIVSWFILPVSLILLGAILMVIGIILR
jgi:hypothetical protein